MRSQRADGLVSIAWALVGGELAGACLDTAAPLETIAQALIDATPGPVVDVVVATTETADKALARAALLAAAAIGGATGGARCAPVPGALAGTIALVRGDRRGVAAGGAAVVAGLAAGVTQQHWSRDVMIAAAAIAEAAAWARRRSRARRREADRASVRLPGGPVPPPSVSLAVDGLSPLVTPAGQFFTTDVRFTPPRIDLDRWRLRVTGMVERPLELSLGELLEMSSEELDATLVCVHNPVGGPRVGSGRWRGVAVESLLGRAGVASGATQLVAQSVDGFTAGVPLSRVLSPHAALVAVGLNGEPLPAAGGFPARLLVPGLWGADANTKWLGELELTTWAAVRDYWDARGWPRHPSAVRPGSRIDVPANRAVVPAGTVTVAGVAWAPPTGVSAVEVAIDDDAWRPAELSAELAPTMWRQWRVSWSARPGEHRIRVRCRAGDRPQPEHSAPPYPVGSSGVHQVRVRVLSRPPTTAQGAAARLAAGADDALGRLRLARRGVVAWAERGFPPAPVWPDPQL